ncbi:DUF6565 domain-containing protein [Hymenobacter sp. BT491]|uniref:DUF6565 domain-containing protein n=1 Tax=Hymenobacter sp. BT491 TaxID=2766779 RepID=UPI001653B1DB|nr:DUF6565 domain-containing protein [Hymenobacter sp. BT491]MBC6988454.1 hypothetical protein [Hymenobacter sp. BT491]
MKRLVLPLFLLTVATVGAPSAASAQQTTTKTTSSTSSTAVSVERDLRSFSDWVNDKVDKAQAGARRNWPKLMSDFDRQSQRLDRATDSLSAQGKREYSAQKSRYQEWAAEQQRLDSQARQPETAQDTQKRLLNEDVNIASARATELPDLYLRLLETTRDQRRQWSQADWSAASVVLERLNARYDKVRDQLTVEDRLRVRSLQAEFRTLEKARAAKDLINESK